MLNQKGMAILEMVPMIIIVTLMINYALGFYGAIHSGSLGSIAARNYLFELMRHRTNVNYFSHVKDRHNTDSYEKDGWRKSVSVSERTPAGTTDQFYATARDIKFNSDLEPVGSKEDHDKSRSIASEGIRSSIAVNPIWIKVGYGICINQACGDN